MGVSDSAKQHAAAVVRQLERLYPEAKCSLDYRTPLQLLVATILSAQCTDLRVNIVTKELFRKYRKAADYADCPIEQLKEDIKSTGFYNAKAKSIQGCCKALVEKHGGEVPDELEALIELPGVGRKTANVVLGTAMGIAAGVVVDTHVGRLSRRLGLTKQKTPEKIEADLMTVLPKRKWIAFSHQMIQHGRRICIARNPKCDECRLNDICPRIDVKK
jgi:endonuclease III